MWLLLDAHIVIWTLVDDGRLPGEARLLIEGEGNEILRNVASSWGGVDIKHATHLDRILTGGGRSSWVIARQVAFRSCSYSTGT